MPNELRRDYVLERYAIIASARMRRPTDFAVPPRVGTGETCPFCPGNERSTPPADLTFLPNNGGIIQSMDVDDQRRSDWLIRCFPNLYPATEPSAVSPASLDSMLQRRPAYGYHEVVIESPNHEEHPGQARVEQLELSLKAALIMMKRYLEDKRVQYVQFYRNHRKEAGASMAHAHSQIIALDCVPRNVGEELDSYRRYMEAKGDCIYCKVIEKERSSQRQVLDNEDFLVLAPWASITPFELWILPKQHSADVTAADGELNCFSRTLRATLGAVSRLLCDPPYNYVFHTLPKGLGSWDYHWHVEIFPKLSVWAGFELGAGMYINVTPPELAAKSLKEPAGEEWAALL